MKKIKLKLVLFLLLLSIFLVFYTGCENTTVIDRLNDTYHIDTQLLKDYEIIYEVTGETFTGRAPYYSILIFQEEPTEFMQSFAKEDFVGFSNHDCEELKNIIESHTCFKIKSEFYPDWNADYLYMKIGEYFDALYFVYFPSELKMIIFEAGH